MFTYVKAQVPKKCRVNFLFRVRVQKSRSVGGVDGRDSKHRALIDLQVGKYCAPDLASECSVGFPLRAESAFRAGPPRLQELYQLIRRLPAEILRRERAHVGD